MCLTLLTLGHPAQWIQRSHGRPFFPLFQIPGVCLPLALQVVGDLPRTPEPLPSTCFLFQLSCGARLAVMFYFAPVSPNVGSSAAGSS